jgi:hypothetical protein
LGAVARAATVVDAPMQRDGDALPRNGGITLFCQRCQFVDQPSLPAHAFL